MTFEYIKEALLHVLGFSNVIHLLRATFRDSLPNLGEIKRGEISDIKTTTYVALTQNLTPFQPKILLRRPRRGTV